MFRIFNGYNPSADQPQAIEGLVQGLKEDHKFQLLHGVTGSGKTFTMANIIQQSGKQAIILTHNKNLVDQLYLEFKKFFPNNNVNKFYSIYESYVPQVYKKQSDKLSQQMSQVNLDVLNERHDTLYSLLNNKDNIVIASVSSIFPSVNPKYVENIDLIVETFKPLDIEYLKMFYTQKYFKISRYTPKNRDKNVITIGDVYNWESGSPETWIEIYCAGKNYLTRIVYDKKKKYVTSILKISSNIYELETLDSFKDQTTGYINPDIDYTKLVSAIEKELNVALLNFQLQGKIKEAKRLKEKVENDIKSIKKLNTCSDMIIYLKLLEEDPTTQFCLLDYFNGDYLLFLDESHRTIPQIKTMESGFKSRMQQMVDHGFKLPCALNVRPLTFNEFLQKIDKCIFASATPGKFESETSTNIEKQILRPTGIVNPDIIIEKEIEIEKYLSQLSFDGQAFLVCSKIKDIEKIQTYIERLGYSAASIHSKLKPKERKEILREFKEDKKYKVLIGVNLLREGIDIPSIELMLILDGDKGGFLRDKTSLTQYIGRVTRNNKGRVIIFAEGTSSGLELALDYNDEIRNYQIQNQI